MISLEEFLLINLFSEILPNNIRKKNEKVYLCYIFLALIQINLNVKYKKKMYKYIVDSP